MYKSQVTVCNSGKVLDKSEMVVRGWLSYTEGLVRQYTVRVQVAVWVYVLNVGSSEGYEHCVH